MKEAGLGADAVLRLKALDSSALAVFVIDTKQANNPIVYINSAFERMTGYSSVESLEQENGFLQAASDRQFLHEINTAIKVGTKYCGIVPSTHKSGNRFLSELSLFPEHDIRGEQTHFIGVLCDISVGNQASENLNGRPVCNEQDLATVNGQLLREVQRCHRVEQEQYAQMQYLRDLQKVTQAIGTSSDPEHWLDACMEVIRDIFQADRAWLLYPCDPEAEYFTIPVEVTVPEYPGLHESGELQPVCDEIKEIMEHVLAISSPAVYHQVKEEVLTEKFSVQSQMLIKVKPQVGNTWILGLHQCADRQNWTGQQQRLFKDIAERIRELLGSVHLYKELKNRENRLRLLLESTEEGIYGIDIDGVCTFANIASAKQLGYEEVSDLVGKNMQDLTGFNCPGSDSNSSGGCRYCLVHKKDKRVYWDGGYFQCADGKRIPVEFRCNPIRYESSVDRATVTFVNISERKKLDEKMWRQANYDSLTGLPGRSLFMNRLVQAIHSAHREKNIIAVMFIDLDHFKLINDTLGHDAGDLLLVEVAHRLKECIRGADTVARFGGDEFAIVLPTIKFDYSIEHVAEKILRILSLPFNFPDRGEYFIGGSIGISLYPNDSLDAEDLLKYADMAMYKAKNNGGNRLAFFTEEMNQAALKHSQIEQELRDAIERNELEIYYQPQIDLHSNTVVGAEALLRWHHPKRGLLQPSEFISLAEESGLILTIDHWVLHEVIRQYAKWHKEGLPAFKILVNVSVRQCTNPKFIDELNDALQECPLSKNKLDLALDFTDGEMPENSSTLVEQLNKICSTGVSLSLDGFGTSHAMLIELKDFPVETIKVARDFIKNINRERKDSDLIRAIISMGHHLGMKVVAEGVETAEQVEFLQQAGCETAYGYYFSEALPIKAFEAYLKKYY